MCALLLSLTAAGLLWPDASPAQRTVRRRTASAMEAMRLMYAQKQYDRVIKFSYVLLWTKVERPEVLHLLASSLDRRGKRDQAATWYALLLRALEKAPARDVRKYKMRAESCLRRLGTKHEKDKARYAEAGPRRFTSPEAVDDVWMTQVSADLHGLHSLYAWKLVGGRKDVKGEWIHNRKGDMHRSGMKYVDEVDGRKGVLFSVPIKPRTSRTLGKHMQATLERLGHPTHVTIRNTAGRRFLRVGVKGYNFGLLLNVYVDGRKVLSRQIPKDAWSDLKIDLSAPAADAATATAPARPSAKAEKPQTVILELTLPDHQRWSEGVWFDYIDFFNN